MNSQTTRVALIEPHSKEPQQYDSLAIEYMIAALIAVWHGLDKPELLEKLLATVAEGQTLKGREFEVWEAHLDDESGEAMLHFNIVIEHRHRVSGRRYAVRDNIVTVVWTLVEIINDLKPMGTQSEVELYPQLCRLAELVRLERNAAIKSGHYTGVTATEALTLALVNRFAVVETN